MDFSTLARRELQALCKKNKIPANITNVAMVDALNALETVEGIEELLKPGESEMEHSSIESPEKNVNTQRSVSRTSYRTSTRQKPAREEDENQQNLTMTRRQGTTRRIARDVEEAMGATPAVRSSRRKAPVVVNQSEEDQKNDDQIDKGLKTVPQTPAAVPGTLRRGTRASTRRNINSDLMEENTTAVRRVYSTRRSVRLSEKKAVESNPAEKETTQPIKMDAFSEDMGEVSENAVVPGSDLQTLVEECSEKTDDSQALVDQNSGVFSEAVKDQNDESVSSLEVSADAVFSVGGDDSQIQEEAKSSLAEEPVLADLVIEEAEKTESDGSNASNNSELDTIQDLVDEEQQSGVNVGQSNGNVAENSPVTDEIEDLELSFAADGIVDSKENDGEAEVDSIESIGEITSNIELESDKSLPTVDFSFQNKDGHIVDIVGPNDDTVEKPKTEPTDGADKPAVDYVGLADDESDFSTDSELDAKEPVSEEPEAEAEADCVVPIEKTEAEPTKVEVSVKSVKTTPGSVKKLSPIKGNFSTIILADDDPLPNSSPLKKPLSLSPLKKSPSKSPLTARRMGARALDDKENIDRSGRKLELTNDKKAKKTQKEKEGVKLKQTSLRQLKTMLREKMQIKNNNNEEEENNVEKVRSALQVLPENQLAVGEVKMEN